MSGRGVLKKRLFSDRRRFLVANSEPAAILRLRASLNVFT